MMDLIVISWDAGGNKIFNGVHVVRYLKLWVNKNVFIYCSDLFPVTVLFCVSKLCFTLLKTMF